MLEEVYLHIGMLKTGSTSIQASLEGYDRDGIRFARLFQNHSIPIMNAFDAQRSTVIPTLHHADPAQAAARSRESMDALLRELTCEHARKLVISGEALTQMPVEHILELKTLLAKHARKTTLLAYIRDPVSFISSVYQQLVQLGGGRFDFSLPDYRQTFEKFISVFGRENFVFRHFSSNSLVNNSAVADFCAQIGISMDSVREIRLNDRMSLEGVQLLNRFNELIVLWLGDPAFIRARMRLVDFLMARFKTPFEIDEAEIRARLDWADIRWMEEECGFKLIAPQISESYVPRQSLERQLDQIAEDTVEIVRAELDTLRIAHTPLDSVQTLVGRLFLHYLVDAFPAPS